MDDALDNEIGKGIYGLMSAVALRKIPEETFKDENGKISDEKIDAWLDTFLPKLN